MSYQSINKIVLFCLLVFNPIFGLAQIDDCIQKALEHNLAIRSSKIDAKIALQHNLMAKSHLFPKITFNNSFTLANGGRTINFASGDLLNPLYGTLYEITGNDNFNVDIPNFKEQFYPNRFFSSHLDLTWGLYNNKARQSHSKTSQQSDIYNLQKKIKEREIVKDVKKTYLEFYKVYRLSAFQEELIEYLEQVTHKTKKLIDFGYAEATDLDYLKYELAKQEQQKLTLEHSLENLKDKFEKILGVPNHHPMETIGDGFLLDGFEKMTITNLDSLVKKKAQYEILRKKEMLLNLDYKATNRLKPDVGLNLKSGFEGFTDSANTKDNFFYLATIKVSWSLYEGGKNKHEKKKIALEKEKLTITTDDYMIHLKLIIRKLDTELASLEASLKVLEKKKELSKRLLDNERKKYLQGDIDMISLLNFKTKYEEDVTKFYNTKISFIQNIIHYNWLVTY